MSSSSSSSSSAASVGASSAPEKAPDDSSKIKTFLSILRKYVRSFCYMSIWEHPLTWPAVPDRFIGVADIASVRFSLPAQLLEPIPNLGQFLPASFGVCFNGRRRSTTSWSIHGADAPDPQSTGPTSTDRRPLSGQSTIAFHRTPSPSDTITTASASRMSRWVACSRCCGSGSPRIWYAFVAPSFFSCYSRHLLNGRQKYIKGKLCKPYNSTLGEFFRVGGASGSDKTPVGLLSG